MFLSLVRPDRISSPITRTAAVTRWWDFFIRLGIVGSNRLPTLPLPMPMPQDGGETEARMSSLSPGGRVSIPYPRAAICGRPPPHIASHVPALLLSRLIHLGY